MLNAEEFTEPAGAPPPERHSRRAMAAPLPGRWNLETDATTAGGVLVLFEFEQRGDEPEGDTIDRGMAL